MKVLHSIYQQIWKPQQWPQDRKTWVFIPIPKKNHAKECSNYHTIALISIPWTLLSDLLRSSASLITLEPLCGSQQTVENSKRNGNTRLPTCLLRNLYAGQESTIRNLHGTIDWFKSGKGVCQGCILSLCLLSSTQTTSCKMLRWMNHKLKQRLPGEISTTSDTQMIPL